VTPPAGAGPQCALLAAVTEQYSALTSSVHARTAQLQFGHVSCNHCRVAGRPVMGPHWRRAGPQALAGGGAGRERSLRRALRRQPQPVRPHGAPTGSHLTPSHRPPELFLRSGCFPLCVLTHCRCCGCWRAWAWAAPCRWSSRSCPSSARRPAGAAHNTFIAVPPDVRPPPGRRVALHAQPMHTHTHTHTRGSPCTAQPCTTLPSLQAQPHEPASPSPPEQRQVYGGAGQLLDGGKPVLGLGGLARHPHAGLEGLRGEGTAGPLTCISAPTPLLGSLHACEGHRGFGGQLWPSHVRCCVPHASSPALAALRVAAGGAGVRAHGAGGAGEPPVRLLGLGRRL
jgi:hypothetical protein